MAACCPPGSLGSVPTNSIHPKGKTVLLSSTGEASNRREDLPCYQIGPEAPKRIICVFSDVFGVDSGNHKVVCDTLQEKLGESTAVWMPDLFRGEPIMRGNSDAWYWDAMAISFSIPSFLWSLRTRITAAGVEQDLAEIVQPHAKDTGCDYVGCVGFCFGGWVVVRALGLESGIFSAGVGIHPALKPEVLIHGGSGSIDTLVQRTRNKPILMLPGKQDHEVKPDSAAVRQLSKRRATSPDQISIEFPEMDHGWVSRGDPSSPLIKENQEKAIHLVLDFFEKHFII